MRDTEAILVSVIVPVWNTEPYLKRCVDSIIKQTHERLEIILIDDGSTDNCSAICDELALLDCRILVIHKVNGGAAAARNAGLDIMTGEWVCFIDSDDYVDERFVEILLDTAIKHNSIVAKCKSKYTFIWDERVVQPKEMSLSMNWFDCIHYLENTPGHAIHSICRGIYKAHLFADLRFPDLRYSEDSLVGAHIFWNGRDSNFSITNQTLYYYYQSVNSVMRSNIDVHVLERYEALDNILSFWVENGENEVYACYFKYYFTKLITDYTELRRDVPGQRVHYEYLSELIYENYTKAIELNLRIVDIPINARFTFQRLIRTNARVILFGFGLYCIEIYKWLSFFGIEILAIWDDYFVGQNNEVLVEAPHGDIVDKESVVIVFSDSDIIRQAKMSRKLRSLGYVNFISSDVIFGAVKYARYREFLPELLEWGECCSIENSENTPDNPIR